MIRTFILKHERGVQRFLEILPGVFSWNLILFPYWGIFFIPVAVAYFILGYNIYWFYQSLQIAITGIISHFRIQASIHNDWMADLKKLKGWEKVQHTIIIVNYKEPLHILERTLDSLAAQTLPHKQLHVVLAMEMREPEADRKKKADLLRKKYKHILPNIYVTVHTLTPDEIVGKSSNEKHAAIWFKEHEIDKKGKDIENFIATSCDADHCYHPKHFASLTYKFLTSDEPHLRFWQAALFYYNNIWRVPFFVRVPNTMGSIWNLSQLPRRDRLINVANYSLSYKLLDEVGYWDADKIPEDWGIFFKAFYKTKGKVEVEANYLPLMADAPESIGFWGNAKNMYEQRKRWAWGVSDDPWIIKEFFLARDIPFVQKFMRVIFVIQAHFFWPVNWFAITIGLQIPTLLNPNFGRTTLGYMVPKISSFILTSALVFLVVMLVLDKIYRPRPPKEFPAWRVLTLPLEFLIMPVVGFFFSALPGLDAHTRLMLGKYIEYRVTEKV